MCGIFGFFGDVKDKTILKKMEKVLKHRGPDESIFYQDNKIGLGMVRLSILDLRKGLYPIFNEKKNVVLVYNGEIYNYKELREELVKREHNFKTDTDAEVIVHAYEEYGEGFIKKLKGMFAFALYDKKEKKIVLGRDRFGIKPLYYYKGENNLLFSSEIKGILESGEVKTKPNNRTIYDYVCNSLYDYSEETFFENILRVMPAHYVTIKKDSIKIKKYWELKKKEIVFESDKKIEKEFLLKFKKSIKDHLISDVPVGSCLSGGLDSSSIVCTINNLIKKGLSKHELDNIGDKQKTFSAVYPGDKINEQKHIEEVIKKTSAEKNLVFPYSRELWKDLKKIVWHQDEPFRTSSIFAQWSVMKKTKEKGVKVLLDGQGADELLGGYVPYYSLYVKDLLRKGNLIGSLKEFFLSLDVQKDFFKRYKNYKSSKKLISNVLSKDFARTFRERKGKWSSKKDLDIKLYEDITRESVPVLLRYEDRNSMAFSIESRVPFLDHEFVEYCYSLPMKFKIRNGWNKVVLRKTMKDILPEKIRKRRDKIGFDTPEAKWLKKLKREIIFLLSSKDFLSKRYFNQREVVEEFKKFCENENNSHLSPVFWKIINLEIWLRTYKKSFTGS